MVADAGGVPGICAASASRCASLMPLRAGTGSTFVAASATPGTQPPPASSLCASLKCQRERLLRLRTGVAGHRYASAGGSITTTAGRNRK